MSGIALHAAKFFSAWTPVALATAAINPAPQLADLFAFGVPVLGGGELMIPPVTCLLAAIGVLGARPLARRGERELSTALFLLVSLLMLVVVEIWVIEHRPSALFAFVIAIGLGFSGYSLIELVGQEMRAFVSSKAKALTAKLGGGEPETALPLTNEDPRDAG